MPNTEHLEKLRLGPEQWGIWRDTNPDIWPDLSGANLESAKLRGFDLRDANLKGANLSYAELKNANLRRARLSGATLEGALLEEADLIEAKLDHANLSYTRCYRANFYHADLRDANLFGAGLRRATLYDAKLTKANLTEANLQETELIQANLTDAILVEAKLREAKLSEAILESADMSRADLSRARLIKTNLTKANLTNCRIYGISAWDLVLEGSKQEGLVVTPTDEPDITVDDIQMAQFIYFLLNNKNIRNAIDTLTTKAVLILGRFTPERKAVLDAIHTQMRQKHDLVPILFDWEPSPSRDLTETVTILAAISRFVVADITDAKSIPQELSSVVPRFPSVPILPIILASQREYAMYEHWSSFNNVLPQRYYTDRAELIRNLKRAIIQPIHEWENATDKAAVKEQQMKNQLAEKQATIAKLQAENAQMRTLLAAQQDTE